MIISPIINGLAFGTFFLLFMLYKYLFLWEYQQPTDTGGLFFPKAIQHVFVGMYVQQVRVFVPFSCSVPNTSSTALPLRPFLPGPR